MRNLLRRNPWLLSFWCLVAAFGTYACMYGFRKPFTAAPFDGTEYGAALKTWLVSAQVLGYTLSKIVGVKVVSEMTPSRRVAMILGLLFIAEIALVLFAVTPAPYNAAWLFVNGLPLGMIFGIVLGFLEGRKLSELFIAGLCASFILADGFTKSVGSDLLARGISQWWMPAAAGAVFIPPLLLFLLMLGQIPPPDDEDTVLRAERQPMTAAERRALLGKYGFTLTGVFLAYMLITVVRSMRADFAPEIWKNLGVVVKPEVYTRSEFYVGITVTALAAVLAWVRSNRVALLAGMMVCLAGLGIGLASFGLRHQAMISPFAFMVMLGIGMYIPYVIIHTSVFERFVALTREKANIGFLMSVADSLGYIGYCILIVLKGSLRGKQDFLQFFSSASVIMLSVAVLGVAAALAGASRLQGKRIA